MCRVPRYGQGTGSRQPLMLVPEHRGALETEQDRCTEVLSWKACSSHLKAAVLHLLLKQSILFGGRIGGCKTIEMDPNKDVEEGAILERKVRRGRYVRLGEGSGSGVRVGENHHTTLPQHT